MFEKTAHLPKVKNKGRVLIVGAGIIGLTTAYQFLKAGYKNVTVYSKEDPLQTNSDVAAALWRPYDGKPEKKANEWSIKTYSEIFDIYYQSLQESIKTQKNVDSNAHPGIHFQVDLEYFAEGRGKPDWMKHADELLISKIELLKKDCHSDDPIIRQAAQHFLNLLEKQQLKISEILEKAPQHVTRKEKYASIVPLMDAPVYRKWLLNQYETLSGKKVEINSVSTLEPDSTEFKELCKNFDVIINCAGEQARNLSQTAKTFPVRGLVGIAEIPSQLTYSIGVEPDPLLDNGHIIISYAIKRGERDVVIGGTYEVLENAPSSPPLSGEEKRKHDLQNIKENIFPLVPGLRSAEELKVHEVREGFRSGSQSMEASLNLIKTESGEKALGAAFGYGGGGYSVAHGVGKEMLVLCNNLSFKLGEAISSPPQLKRNTPS